MNPRSPVKRYVYVWDGKKIESMVPCQAFKGKLSKNVRETTLNFPNDKFEPISNIMY